MHLRKAIVPVVTGLLVTSAVVWAVEEQYDENRERDMVEHAAVDLAKAIRTAERATGGRAIGAGAEVSHGQAYFEVTARTLRADEQVRIDAVTGRVMDTRRLSAAGPGSATRERRMTLADAVSRAEAEGGGRAMEAESGPDHGKTVYTIELAQGDDIRKVTVGPGHGPVSGDGAAHSHRDHDGGGTRRGTDSDE